MAAKTSCSVPDCSQPRAPAHFYCESHFANPPAAGVYGFKIFAMAAKDIVENARTYVTCVLETSDGKALDPVGPNKSELAELSKDPTWTVGFTFPAIPLQKKYSLTLSVFHKDGKFLGKTVFPDALCKAMALEFGIKSVGVLKPELGNKTELRGIRSGWEPLQARKNADGQDEPAGDKWKLGYMHYVLAPVGTQLEHLTPTQLKPPLDELRSSMEKMSAVAQSKKSLSVDIERSSASDGEMKSLRSLRVVSTKQVSERVMLPDRIGRADVIEIEKLLTGRLSTAQEKQILAIIERASLSPERLNAIFHTIDVNQLLSSLGEGVLFKGRAALLTSLSGPYLSLLDQQSKQKICDDLWKRNKEGLETECLDRLLLSLDRICFENGSLAAAWLKAHQRHAMSTTLSDKLIATAKTGVLAETGNRPSLDGVKMIDALVAWVRGHLPNKGVGVRLEDHDLFNEYLSLLGADSSFRSRIDFASHKQKYTDAAYFIEEIGKGLKINPIVVAFLEEWDRQPAQIKARAFPPPSQLRSDEIVRAIVYCYFLDVMTHALMFEKPADVQPPLEAEEETLMETVTRLSSIALHSTDWWKYLDFSEHIAKAATDYAWEHELLPYKRKPFPKTWTEEQKHKGEILKFQLFEVMFRDLLRESDTETGFALVRGTMQKGSSAFAVPDLGVGAWQESVMQPVGYRAVPGQRCRMGFGAEPEALSPVWENLYMSWRLRACFTETGDGTFSFSKILAPIVANFYQSQEGSGHFLTFRLPVRWLHWQVTAMSRVRTKKTTAALDWRSPHVSLLWSKVNKWAAGQYLTRLDAIIQKQEIKVAEQLKAQAATDLASWGKMQHGMKKHSEGGHNDFHNMDWLERMTRLFWKICAKNHPDAVMLQYEQEIFRRGTRKFMGATTDTGLYEADEKSLVCRTKDGLIDPHFYNSSLKQQGIPLLEDLIFNRRGLRSMALGNQVRIGTIYVEVFSVRLEEQQKPLRCVLESCLTPRGGKFQGSIHTEDSDEAVWNEAFLVPVSSRSFANGAVFVIELWRHKEFLGSANFTLDDLKDFQVKTFSKEGKKVWVPLVASGEFRKSLSMNLYDSEFISIGDIEVAVQVTLGDDDTLCTYNSLGRLPDEILHRCWPAKRSAAKIPPPALQQLRTTIKALLPSMKTGDLILWASSHDHGDLPTRLMNRAMNELTTSIYTHAAIVYVVIHPRTKERMVFHVESGVNRLMNLDCISKTPFGNSIFVTDLAERVENHGYTMVYKPLLIPLEEKGRRAISRFITHMWLKDPLFASTQLVAAGLEKAHLKLMENTEDWNQTFCSEFVSACYKLAGVREYQGVNTSNLSPAEVAAVPIYGPRCVLLALQEHAKDLKADIEATHNLVRTVSERSLAYSEMDGKQPPPELIRLGSKRQLHDGLEEAH